MIPRELLGRYHCIDPSKNHRKFWHIVFDRSTQTYIATWGRIGNSSPAPKEYTEAQVRKKVREKIKKGYYKADGYTEVIGSQSIHFIKEFCSG